MIQLRCIFCEEQLEFSCPEDSNINFDCIWGGGRVDIDFGFGSRFDRIRVDNNIDSSLSRPENLTRCAKICGAICDDCFEARHNYFHGIRDANLNNEKWEKII